MENEEIEKLQNDYAKLKVDFDNLTNEKSKVDFENSTLKKQVSEYSDTLKHLSVKNEQQINVREELNKLVKEIL